MHSPWSQSPVAVTAVTPHAVPLGSSAAKSSARALRTPGPSSAHSAPLASNRVKVAVRCRPAFEEEGPASVVDILSPPPGSSASKGLQLQMSDGKRREFTYDVVFGAEATNHSVYDAVAGPIVDGVMRGVNGTVLAYGQTGSGKTHSLGILTRVTGEAGIIPRSLSHIFGFIAQAQAATKLSESAASPGAAAAAAPSYSVTLSFCQLYLDSVHDLLAPAVAAAALPPSSRASVNANDVSILSVNSTASGTGSVMANRAHWSAGNGAAPGGSQLPGSLPVREDPARGFYVEGLSEYTCSTFQDALNLLNAGLENRVLGSTAMNATSSRSHTLLFVKVETRTPVALGSGEAATGKAGVQGVVYRRSQLMLCDLAGSERVRRTSSRGARLEEARAINASLHTLGQVISALSVLSQQHQMAVNGGHGSAAAAAASGPKVHVPWRDSKLTRLLYGNLGGNSNTFLLATVGPSARNVNETLSTLLFASRCMRVAATPAAVYGHSNVDYADLCARLQQRLSSLEAMHAGEVGQLRQRYEAALTEMQARAEAAERAAEASAAHAGSNGMAGGHTGGGGATGLDSVSVSLFGADADVPWLNASEISPDASGAGAMPVVSVSSVARQLYASLCAAYDASAEAVAANTSRAAKHGRTWERAIERAVAEEADATTERDAMTGEDPLLSLSAPAASADGTQAPAVAVPGTHHPDDFGPHLGHDHRSPAAAMRAVHQQHAHTGTGSAALLAPAAAPATGRSSSSTSGGAYSHPAFEAFPSFDAFMSHCNSLSAATISNITRLGELFMSKDSRFDEVKRHLAAAEAALRVRDEDVQNQRYVLKYLVDSSSQLKEKLRRHAAAGCALELGAAADGGLHTLHASLSGDDAKLDFAEEEALAGESAGVSKVQQRRNQAADSGSSSAHVAHAAAATAASIASTQPLPGRPPRPPSRAGLPPTYPTMSITTAPAPVATPVVVAVSLAAPAPAPAPAPARAVPAVPAAAPAPAALEARAPTPPPSALYVPQPLPTAAPVVMPEQDQLDAEEEAAEGVEEGVDDEDGEEEEDGGDEVDAIVAHRLLAAANGSTRLLYKVHWRNSDSADDEWFPRDDLIHDYPDKVAAYEVQMLQAK